MKNIENMAKRILLDESISGFDSLSVNSAVNGKDKRTIAGA
ncbi:MULTISPECIES: hypothetical protein [unclassified Archaeoglobus]|nr:MULTISPECIES: hypothetical protein [unclassified Archaeoglobus]